LGNAGHPDVQRAGNTLSFLRTMRNRADYDLDRPFPHALAVGQVQAAVELIPVLEQLGELPVVLSRVTDAMRAYERDVLGEGTWRP
jgi:hypothetical protein